MEEVRRIILRGNLKNGLQLAKGGEHSRQKKWPVKRPRSRNNVEGSERKSDHTKRVADID